MKGSCLGDAGLPAAAGGVPHLGGLSPGPALPGRPGTPFFALVNAHNANLAYLRVRRAAGRDAVFTIVVNRWHDNVNFLLKENVRLDPSKDRANFVKGMIGSYPNFFFDVREQDLPDFVDLLTHFNGGPQDLQRLAKYGINRADERFWDTYDWFQKRLLEDESVHGGLPDLNR